MKSITELFEAQEQLDAVSPSFCLAKWKNATLHLHNGNTQSCHHVKSHPVTLDPDNPSSLHNSPAKLRARSQMIRGKRPPECQYCWKVEDKGEISDRVHKSSEATYNDYFSEVVESGVGPKTIPSFLEVSFDHACQFRCMYCSPAYSTQWEKEIKQFGPYTTTSSFLPNSYNRPLGLKEREKYINAFWSWWPELREHLRYMRVTGGEPLLSKQTFKLIDDLIAKPCKTLNFSINSNLGIDSKGLKNLTSKIIQLQGATRSVSIFTSIDSVEEEAEYIRYGLNYAAFMENVNHLLTHVEKPLTFCFVITVNLLSLTGLSPLLDQIAKLKKKFPHHNIHIDTPYLKNPRYLSVEILTADFKKYIDQAALFAEAAGCFSESECQKIARIQALVGNPSLNSAMLFLLRKDFHRFIAEYDRRKGLNRHAVFSRYKTFFETCESTKLNFDRSFLKRSI